MVSYFHKIFSWGGFIENKYDGLWNFAYDLSWGNCFENGYFTEKSVDPIITESLCFYDGSADIESIIGPRAFVKIDLHNKEKPIEIIASSIHDNKYFKRLPYIRKAKMDFLKKYHPFKFILDGNS